MRPMRDDAVVITGSGAICAAGETPQAIWDRVRSGSTAIAPVRAWKAAQAVATMAGQIEDFDPLRLLPERKVHKLLRRSDVLGLYAAGAAIENAEIEAARRRLDTAAAQAFDEATGVFVAAEGGAYENQYEFFPLLSTAGDDMHSFGRELEATINPMWLLRSLPNTVLCQVGIRWGFKGPNACLTQHGSGGSVAALEAVAALHAGEAERAIVVAHSSPIEPQLAHYYAGLGLVSGDLLRPFDARRTGSVLGEGAGALVVERAAAAAGRGARMYGEWLGAACVSEGEGILEIRADGDGLARAITLALEDAGLAAGDVGCVIAHGNGTTRSDASEAESLRRVFHTSLPPVTSFKWAFGHTLSASAVLEMVLALRAVQDGELPGIGSLCEPDPECGLPVARWPQRPRSDVALVLSRGFAGVDVAVLLRGVRQ
jgi:3-oxoacyl-[acyl-carrier-protein] synthase-1